MIGDPKRLTIELPKAQKALIKKQSSEVELVLLVLLEEELNHFFTDLIEEQ